MRITQSLASLRGRVKERIVAPQRRAAAELIGTLILCGFLLCILAVAANTPQHKGN